MARDIKIGIAKLSETGSRHPSNFAKGPDVIEQGGLYDLLSERGCSIIESKLAALTPEEEREYGAWHRLGLASRHLAEIVADQRRRGLFPLGLLSNCNGLMGMLGGLQHGCSTPRPLRVGLVWIDAHGDFNTPETTLSGMLGGMPVAVSAGLCLHRLREKCGLDPALPTRYIVMMGVRDTDPLEQELLDRSEVQHLTVDHIKRLSPAIDLEMERLARLTDLIYVHIDMDALDPTEVPGHGLTVPEGPSSREMAKVLEMIFEHPSAAAFGVASYPANKDPEKKSLRAVYKMIEGVIRGLENRGN
ncbi:MAG: arginase family protein [Candidatus Bathyarchaeota archaeon]|jgi:arginase